MALNLKSTPVTQSNVSAVYPHPHNMMTADGKVCKPSRKNFERQCKLLADEIHLTHMKLSDNKAHLNELFSKLEKLREERNGKFAEKSRVEGSVKDMSVDINKLTDRLAQMQSKLHYRDMKKLEDAIRTLQVHLDSRHFKHCEEKKIVAEIDKLNRSKKIVGGYLETQSEMKELRGRQHARRTDRDKLIKEIVTVRKQEEMTRGKITDYKTQELQLRADLESLNGKKKELSEHFKKHQEMYEEQKSAAKQATELQLQKQQNQSRLIHSTQIRCLGDDQQRKVDDQPPSMDMVNCQQLIEFCQRLATQTGGSKAAMRQRKRKISYTPDLLTKFVSLDICPPMTIAHALDSIPLLEQKLVDLNHEQNMQMVTVIEEIMPSELTGQIDWEPSLHCIADEVPVPDDIAGDAQDVIESEQPDDQSDKSSLSKQFSNSSDEDIAESMIYKLVLLESLYHREDLESNDAVVIG